MNLLHAGENRASAGFGWVRSQHRFYTQGRQGHRKGFRIGPGSPHFSQGLRPGSWLVLGSINLLIEVPHGIGRDFLRQIQKTKSDRISARDLGRLNRRQRSLLSGNPWQGLEYFVFPNLLHQLTEAVHHPREIPLHASEPPLETLLMGKLRFTHAHARSLATGLFFHVLKLSPHEQVARALGLVTRKPPFCRSVL